MGTEYYLHDDSKHEVYETGKWQSLNHLVELLHSCNGDETQIKYLIYSEYDKYHWNEEYTQKVVEDIYRFLKDRNPRHIRVVSEHDLFDNEMIYKHKTAQVGSRYYLDEPEKNAQENAKVTEWWANSWQRAQDRRKRDKGLTVQHYPDHWTYMPFHKGAKTQITVEDIDSFGAAARFTNPAVLCFASAQEPGGGYQAVMDVAMPIKTQEEDLYRRSDLPELMDNDVVRKYYPLKGVDALYARVTVSKDSCLKPVRPFKCGVITVPAVIHPETPEQLDLVRQRAERILGVAAANNHHHVILGAWGCGVFGNQPEDIARVFLDLLNGPFKGEFLHVVFAVPGKESTNHRIFESVLTGKSISETLTQ